MKVYLLMFILLSLFIPLSVAETYEMPLLAVNERDGILNGSIADLFASIEQGSGRVFIDTFPITKTDTQMSTRLAQKIACSFLERDCRGYDFFYTIRADSSIIGGPSASAAIAVITVAALEGLELQKGVSITGTINSGTVIGPVGGVKEKVEAAARNGITKVLIPAGESIIDTGNQSINLSAIADNLSIELVEVSLLDEAVYHMTGKRYDRKTGPLVISQSYTQTMMQLAQDLCNRSDELKTLISIQESLNGNLDNQVPLSRKEQVDENKSAALIKTAMNLSRRGKAAFHDLQFYSSASYCFGANLRLRTELLKNTIDDPSSLVREAEILTMSAEKLESEYGSVNLQTITDLQTYMIVQERISEARESLKSILTNMNRTLFNATENRSYPYDDLAYSQERLYSATSWAHFFGGEGDVYQFNEGTLKDSCVERLSEVEEAYQYASLYLPVSFIHSKDEYERAFDDMRAGEYALCLFKASKAKAETNVLLSLMGINDDARLSDLIGLKLEVAKWVIGNQAGKGRFPIVGYSYYEYAHALKESDPYSALLYAEYALELSNLDIYFPTDHSFNIAINDTYFIIMLTGIFTGAASAILIMLLLFRFERK